MANDVILALDLQTGEQTWKTTLSGVPAGRSSSSTPCFADGKIFAVGGDRIFAWCRKWKITLGNFPETEAVMSSPLCRWKSFCTGKYSRAFDVKTGKQIWENNSVKGKTARRYALGKSVAKDTGLQLIENSFCLDPQTGETIWEGPGGGASTLRVQGITWWFMERPKM